MKILKNRHEYCCWECPLIELKASLSCSTICVQYHSKNSIASILILLNLKVLFQWAKMTNSAWLIKKFTMDSKSEGFMN